MTVQPGSSTAWQQYSVVAVMTSQTGSSTAKQQYSLEAAAQQWQYHGGTAQSLIGCSVSKGSSRGICAVLLTARVRHSDSNSLGHVWCRE
jgi:hypothetical protein